MIRDEHNHGQRVLVPLSDQHSHRPTRPQDADGNNIRSNDATSIHRTGLIRSPDQNFSDVDPYYLQSPVSVPISIPPAARVQAPPDSHQNTMVDTESQNSQETMIASRHVRISRISGAFSKSFTFWERLNGKGRQRVGWLSSLKAIATFTCKSDC